MIKAIKYMLMALILASLWVPLSNGMFGYIPEWPLDGSFKERAQPEFRWSDWFDGSFQLKAEPWLNEQISGREYLIRFRNQYYFSLFSEAKANNVVVGKNGVLLDKGYINAFYGTDYAGDKFLHDKLTRWKRVQHGLDSLGVKGFIALAPGKASFFEKDFPNHLRVEHQQKTNYEFIANQCLTNDMRFIDLKKIYHELDDTSRYPLFTKGGIHWSEYGVALICDTLRRYIQSLTGRPTQDFWFEVELSDTARGVDNDIARSMNLLHTPNEEKLAYPKRYYGDDPNLEPTKFLTIGDSYYYNLVYSAFQKRICSHGGFWYYFKKSYPSYAFHSTKVEELDILEEIKKQDVLMLMMTEPQLKRFGWGSVEKIEALLYPDSTEITD